MRPSRLSGLTVAAISAAVLIADPGVSSAMCRNTFSVAFCSILGAGLVYQWLIRSSRQLLPLEYLSLIAIALLDHQCRALLPAS